ncbi:toll/interleukin-1 receptor domain-containing protein [Bifidobacterium oedipodis]|uniref:ATPase, AAA superfamily n=1 Tax=Bifidobacterium oedipodis TaxID=2675322 RepID=A0A7Y0HUI1_9BIFI|nr:toll/interleukin-1 receptor domain-containing protein [Bifidobacterium sp. DSM 109957]NMM95207.1 ATPase, AAA superfamily [Bifidobacterium sp. DSM 109957]
MSVQSGLSDFRDRTQAEEATSSSAVPTDAHVFLSYSHDDDNHLNGGIIRFMKDVVEEYTFQVGNTLQLFIDKESINWGDNWRTVLERSVGAANIIIPAITPRYMRSRACRKELLDFEDAAQGDESKQILPLMIQNIDEMSGIDRQDPVWIIAHDKQWHSLDNLRMLSEKERQEQILEVVRRLRVIIKKINQTDGTDSNAASLVGADSTVADETDQPDVLASWGELEQIAPRMKKSADNFTKSVNTVAELMSSNPAPVNGTATQYAGWASGLASQAQPVLDSLNKSTEELTSQWKQAYDGMANYVNLVEMMPQGDSRNQMMDSMGTTFDSLGTSLALPNEVMQLIPLMRVIGSFAKPLRPLANSLEKSIGLIESMHNMVELLQKRLDRIPR